MTPKQEKFVEEYLVDLNGKQAAIRAGYHASRAERTACELLATRKVSEAVAAGRKRLSERTQRTVDAVMADIGRVRDDAMRLIRDQDTGDEAMRSHKDALRALELEGKHLGAFVERVDVTASVVTEIRRVMVKPKAIADDAKPPQPRLGAS